MTRLRVTITLEYDAHNDNDSYGTDDPYEMAKVDEDEIQQWPSIIAEMMELGLQEDDGSCVIRVDPV